MTVKTGAAWSGLIVCKDATGALSAASVGPVGALYVDGTVTADVVTVTGANPYKWTVTLPALTAGQRVSMYITATVDSIATASVVAEESADTYITSDIEALVDDIGIAGAGLTAIPTIANVTTVGSVTGSVGSVAGNVVGSVGSVTGLTAANLDATISSRAPASTALTGGILADSVPADGTRPTPEQALYAIYCYLMERAVSGTTVTVKKVDGSTSLMTFTINDASAPTSITRTT